MLYVCVVQLSHCLEQKRMGVVSEKEFYFQQLYLFTLLEHSLVVE